MLVDHEGVPRGKQWARKHRDNHGVVDVADDPVFLVFVDHKDVPGHGFGVVDEEFDVVPPGFQVDGEAFVDHASAVGVDIVDVSVDANFDGVFRHRG